jgi:hypothetical protein
MARIDDYLAEADKCERQAHNTPSPRLKRQLLNLAAELRRFADFQKLPCEKERDALAPRLPN